MSSSSAVPYRTSIEKHFSQKNQMKIFLNWSVVHFEIIIKKLSVCHVTWEEIINRLCPSLWGWWSPVNPYLQTTGWAFHNVLDLPSAPAMFYLCVFLQKTIGEILASMEVFSRFETILEVSRFVSAQEAVQLLLLYKACCWFGGNFE